MDPITAITAFLVYYPVVVAVASAITVITPTPKDDGVLKKVRKVLDVLALNLGNARNAR